KKLLVWQKAHAMVLDVNRVAGQIRSARHSALRGQIMRAAMSVTANIVEGAGQQSPREFSRFRRISRARKFNRPCGSMGCVAEGWQPIRGTTATVPARLVRGPRVTEG
ncbi:MAG: four helix bundle protein, partial [Gemmatimonadaceae bacterium]|nr:four helix bundle protein [Gemmatimonadaceae bacterium]